jgi:hypothetical protein
MTVLRASQVAGMIRCMYAAGSNLWVWGPPGVGKTELVQEVCEGDGIPLMTHPPGVTMESVDVRGLPTICPSTGRTVWAPSDFWPTDRKWKGVVYLDELPQAATSTQAAYMQAVQSRRIGNLSISPGAVFVVTGNRAEDRAGVGKILTPLLNRFTHCDMAADLADWQSWAVGAGVRPEVRSFLNFKPSLLMDFDPKSQQRAFASPRSWARLSGLLGEAPEELLFPAAAGTVGEGPATEFLAFLRTYGQLPDIDEILKQPATAPLPAAGTPSTPAIYCALAGALAERLKGGKNDTRLLDAFATYVLRWPASMPEFQTLAVKDAVAMDARLLTNRVLQPWLFKNAKVLSGRR